MTDFSSPINPYVAEAVDRFRRAMFFFVLIGLSGLLLAVIHEQYVAACVWGGMILATTLYRVIKLREIEENFLTEDEAAPTLARVNYTGGINACLFSAFFTPVFDQTIATIVTIASILIVVSVPIIAPTFIYKERKLGLLLYMLASAGLLSMGWMRSNHPVVDTHVIAIFIIAAGSYLTIIFNLSRVGALERVGLDEAIFRHKIERAKESTQLQVAQMSHNIRQTVQALNFQLEEVGEGKNSLRRQLALMDKFLVRLQDMGARGIRENKSDGFDVSDVGELAADSIEVFRSLAAKSGIVVSSRGPQIYVKLGPEDIYFVLCNLISNTIRHSRATAAQVVWVEMDGFVEIEYRDNGTGLRYDGVDLQHREGSQRYGVDSIEATLNARGIPFYWDWDAKPGISFRFYVEKIPRSGMNTADLCIVIEDDLVVADYIAKTLATRFSTVLTASRFEEAIMKCHEFGSAPKLVVSDLNLNAGGLAHESVLAYIKKARAVFSCDVVVLTGDISQTMDSTGALAVLHKPVDRAALEHCIDSILEHRIPAAHMF